MGGSGEAGSGAAWRPFATLAGAILAAILIVTLAQRGFAAASGWPPFGALGGAAEEGLFTLVLFGALLAVAMAGLGLDGRLRGLAGVAPLPKAAAGAALGLFGLLAAAACAALAAVTHHGVGASHGTSALVIGTVAILFQAGTEEVYFRGWLQPALVRRWGEPAGLLVATAAFAALHVVGGTRAPLALVNLFLGGLLFGLLALRTRGLAAPAAAHFGWNWAEQILLGLDPNPGTGSFGAIFDVDLVGSPWWGGSGEGLNAGIATSFVLAALIIPVAAWRPPARA